MDMERVRSGVGMLIFLAAVAMILNEIASLPGLSPLGNILALMLVGLILWVFVVGEYITSGIFFFD